MDCGCKSCEYAGVLLNCICRPAGFYSDFYSVDSCSDSRFGSWRLFVCGCFSVYDFGAAQFVLSPAVLRLPASKIDAHDRRTYAKQQPYQNMLRIFVFLKVNINPTWKPGMAG